MRAITIFITILAFLGISFRGAGAADGIDCYSIPYDSRCAGFAISNDELDHISATICDSYPGIPGCYFRERCIKNKPWIAQACTPAKIVSTICSDKPSAPECGSYLKLCRGNSVVSQCYSHHSVPNPPSLIQAANSVKQLCSSISSSECKDCTKAYDNNGDDPSAHCKYVEVWAKLCEDSESKGMFECVNLAQLCSSYKGTYGEVVSEICSKNKTALSEDVSIPPETALMFSKSYFYFSTNGYFLFKSWFVRRKSQFVLSAIASIIIGSLSSKVLRSPMKRNMLHMVDSDADYGLNFDDIYTNFHPTWGLTIAKTCFSFLGERFSIPGIVMLILGNAIQIMLTVPIVSAAIMIISTGNMLWILFFAIGFALTFY